MSKLKLPHMWAALVFCILLSQLPAQGELLAASELPIPQASESNSVKSIVVDRNSTVNSYPSMEKEMKMLVALRSETPQAYFFPDPSNGIVWIEHNLGDHVELKVLNSDGEVIFKAKDLKAKKLDFKDYESGRYMLMISNGSFEVARSLDVR